MFSLAISAVLSGCQAPATIDAWAVGDSVALSPTIPRQSDEVVFDPQARKIRLHSAANETVSFQLVIDAPPAGLSNVKVYWSDLAGGEGRKIAASSIRAFRCLAPPEPAIPPWYTVLIGPPPPVDLYDILVPVDPSLPGQLPNLAGVQGTPNAKSAPTHRVLAPQRMAMWFDLEVPRMAKGDIYNGSLSISAEGASTWKAAIELKVYDIVLSDQRPVIAIGGFDHRRLFAAMVRRDGQPYIPARLDPNNKQVQKGLAIIRQMANLARQHGLDTFETQVRPLLKRDASGSIRLDWQDYDAIVCAYLDGSAFDDKAGAAAWPMPCEADWPNPEHYGGTSSKEYKTAARATLAACRKHFETKGWAQRAFLWPSRRLTDEEADPIWRKLAGQTDVVILTPAADTDAASRPADKPRKMIVTSHEEADPAVIPRADEKPSDSLAGYWLRPGLGIRTPSLAGPAPPIDARALVLMAMKDGYRGLFIDDCLCWDSAGQPTADKVCLFYPSTEDGQVLPSIRLKQFRRGMQDAAYLQLLRRHNRDKTASMILDTLTRCVNPDNGESDMQTGQGESAQATWELARRLMVEELNSAINSGSPPRSIAAGGPSPTKATSGALAQQIAWDRYWNQSRTVRLESARCRAAPGQAGRFKAQLSVGLLNELAGKLEAQVAWQNLPEGWQAAGPSERIATLEAFSRSKVTLSAEGENIPVTENAKAPMPFSLAIEGSQPRPLVAEMAILQPAVFSSPPVIDGSLDDWPLRSGNCAGNFVLLPRADGRSGQAASKQTLVFAAVDRNNLYLAFRCKEDDLASLKANPNNLVRYEQYMPGGEDLIEVLLDPGDSSRSIEDVYHVAVKPNGAVLAHRGVACDPPLGRVKPWTGPASVAVGRAKGVWIVEMAIPLEAFGPAGRERCWGVNFVRFNPAGPEASSWSPAIRHFYDPSTFGLMILPAPAATGPAVSGQR